MEEPAPRMFWPRQVWGRYAEQLADFKEPSHRTAALQCLNHLVTDALRHLPHCLDYMRAVRHPMNFRFCAIPQIMAMGTLALCYNNGRVFEGGRALGLRLWGRGWPAQPPLGFRLARPPAGAARLERRPRASLRPAPCTVGVVKLRRGQTAKIFATCGDMGSLYAWLLRFLRIMQAKVDTEVAHTDPSYKVGRPLGLGLAAGAGCWGWLLGLAAGAGCWGWLLGLAAGGSRFLWARLTRLLAAPGGTRRHQRPLPPQETHRAVASSIAACEQGLRALRKEGGGKGAASAPAALLVLAVNALLLLLAGVLFHQSWQLGGPEEQVQLVLPVDFGKGLSALLLLGALYRAMWPAVV
jgi:hypothetical protein